VSDDGMTQTERTLKAIKAEWVNAERERIWTAIDAIDPIDWALGSAYYMIETIVRGES
jgi:hypothetical protein